jgi:hypothetical protein
MAWYNPSWNFRVKITVLAAKVDANQTDFPVYVDLSDLPAGFFSNVNADGSDIRVTQGDGTTEQAREVVYITTGSSIGELHFKASSLSSSTNTAFYIYYGNSGASEPAADATYGSENTWNSSYLGVYHMQEDPSGTPPQILDSTASGNHGTSNGTMTSGDSVSGKLSGNALEFDGSDDFLDVGDDLFDTENVGTISAWVNESGGSVQGSIYSSASQSASNELFRFYINNLGTGDDFQLVQNLNPHNRGYGGVALTAAAWNYVSITSDSSLWKLWLNGAFITYNILTGSNAGNWFDDADSGTNEYNIGDTAQSTGRIDYFIGIMDEVRITNDDKDSTFISTEYNNQSSASTFYSVGVQEGMTMRSRISIIST